MWKEKSSQRREPVSQGKKYRECERDGDRERLRWNKRGETNELER
jgi:ribosomal protein S14